MDLTKRHNGTSPYRVTFSPTGCLLQLAEQTGPKTDKYPSVRGRIQSFSPRARGRIFQKMAKVPTMALSRALFMTLTYPAEFPHDPKEWKRQLKVFSQKVKRKFPHVSWVWKMEPQKRGAPHFHMLVFGAKFIPIATLLGMWDSTVKSGDPNHAKIGVDIKQLVSKRQAMYYVGKYIAKGIEQVDKITGELPFWDYPGRWWGVHNRPMLPQDVQEWAIPGRPWVQVKRWLCKYMEKKGKTWCFSGLGGGWVMLPADRIAKLLELTNALGSGSRLDT